MDQRSLSHHTTKHGGQQKHPPSAPHASKRNYKLLIDPVLVNGANKLYRFEGVVEGDPTYPPVVLRDPRKQKIWIRPETLDLQVPRFKIDSDYVGPPPPLEVTIFNINDNIDRQFLHNEIVNKHQCGSIQQLEIFTHELSRKHLGVARLVFEEPESARHCVRKLNNATLMGKVLQVFLDPFGEECKKRVKEVSSQLEEEAKREEEAKEAKKRPPLPTKPPPPPPPDEEPQPPRDRDRDRDRHSSEKPEFDRNRYDEARKPTSSLHQQPPPPAITNNSSVSSTSYYQDHRQAQYGYQQQQNYTGYDHYHHYQGYSYHEFRAAYPAAVPPGHHWGGPGGPGGPGTPNNGPPPPQAWPPHHTPHHTPQLPPPGPPPPQVPPPDHHNRYHVPPPYQRNTHNTSYTNSTSTPKPKEEPDTQTDTSTSSNSKPKNESEEEEDKSNLDLDTRIAMLLQNKDSGMAPPFLALGLGSDEEEEKKGQEEKKETKQTSSSNSSISSGISGDSDSSLSDSEVGVGSKGSKSDSEGKSKWTLSETILEPLSTPPSPYLNQEMYLHWHEKGNELKMEAQRRERQENRERLKKLKKKKVKKKHKEEKSSDKKDVKKTDVKVEPNDENQVNGIDDDRMSLSSLSSTEDPILHQDVPIPPISYNAPPPGYSHYNAPPYPQSYLPPAYPPPPTSMNQDSSYSWQPPPGYPPNFGYPGYNPGYMALPTNFPQMSQPPPGTAIPGQAPYYFGPGYPQPQDSTDATHKSGEYHDPTINAVLDTVIEELKNILKKDFNKRMIEATAFKTFEAWWDEQERKFKAQAAERENTDSSQGPQARIEKINNISTLLEPREGFGLDSLGSLGLGFRAAMPKMPSFRKIRKIKPPSPPCMDEDSRGVASDDDSSKPRDLSDSNLTPTPKTKLMTKRKVKWSSDESGSESEEEEKDSSSSSSSSSSSASSSESSSASESEDSEDEKEEEEEEEGQAEAEVESEEVTELRRLQAEFDADIRQAVEAIMRTPEHDRPTTPLPELSKDVPEDNAWLVDIEEMEETLTTATTTPTTASSTQSSTTPQKLTSLQSEKTPSSAKFREPTPLASKTKKLTPKSKALASKRSPVKAQTPTKKKGRRKMEEESVDVEGENDTEMPARIGHSIDSETDTADEKSDLEDGHGESEAAAEALVSLSGGDVNGRVRSASSSSSTSSSSSSSSSAKASVSTGDEERSPVLMEHSYCLPWAPKDGTTSSFLPPEGGIQPTSSIGSDHDYTRARTPPPPAGAPPKIAPKFTTPKPRGKENRELQQIKKEAAVVMAADRKRHTPASRSIAPFKPRNQIEEYNVLYSFLIRGIDQEDIELLKRSYEGMLADDSQSYWLNDTHWVDHPATDIPCPPKKKRRIDDLPLHKTGCARTEGIYKVDSKQKQKHKFTFHQDTAARGNEEQQQSLAVLESSKAKLTQMAVSREVRSFQRRLLTAFGNETDSDLLKFNQLKFRKKLLRFGKSRIHDWGLFAMEAIGSDEMVIEYVGQSIRSIIADLREIQYEKIGIGSSYLFRIDMESIIDATKCGNLARFINHSCNPNCYAKIISVENMKKIVIYSKQPIPCGEEITYDYKFPIEEEKIVCLCGATQCKGTLN